MKSAIALFLLGLFFAVLQTTVLPEFFKLFSLSLGFNVFWGQSVDLVLILLVFLALRRDAWSVLLWASIFALMVGLFGTYWRGAASASYFLLPLFCLLTRKHLLLESPQPIAIYCGFLSFLRGVLHLFLGQLVLGLEGAISGQWENLIVQPIITAIAAPILFPILEGISQVIGDQHRRGRNELVLS